MRKMNFIAVIASAIFLFSSTTAISGPYNIPAARSQFTPHLAQPVLKLRPTINYSTGHVKTKKKAARKRTRRTHTSVPKVILKPAAQKRFRSGVQVHRHVAIPAVGDRAGGTGNGGFAPRTGLATENVQANQAKEIGEAGARMKQIRELQRIRDLGSPIDQARRGANGNGRQDCSRSPNRAACLRNNMNAGQKPNLPNGDNQRSMQACLQAGGSVVSCRRGNKGGTPGHLSAGPGSAPGAQHIPGRGQAQSGSVTTEERPDRYGVVTQITTVHTDDQGRVTGTDETVRLRVRRNEYVEHHYHTDAHGHETIQPDTIYHVIPRRHRHRGHSNQPAPEGSNGRADNCNWNPALGKCMKPRLSGIGMTSQPGPDGQNPGVSPGSATPHIGSDAVTNPGDGSWEARGFGSGSHGKRLDMKEEGTKVGGTPK